ncbi:small glutamine-rich tetratricopeptide repeat-containing protein alpha-like [Liolophura sinensis]|uniref:small glutamine-rich tetratricopeptide repeat-containing protein alpha-like n=1 Tax=Liolophura sinensis TaxID=3198878 RepID=UPI0031584B0D
MADVRKLVFSILRFLEDQKTSGSLSDEDVESVEVACQCLESSYKVNVRDPESCSKYQVPMNLLDIFNSYLDSQPDTDLSNLSLHEPTPEERTEAEKLKTKGNDFMSAEQFSEALETYTKAIKLDGKNAVYYCNRAAAFSKLNKHAEAIEDCNKAIMIDPNYSKAYGRMGIAYTSLNDHAKARECYRKALELDPDRQSYQNNLEIAEQKLREESLQGGGLGGMDFSSILSNPALMNMATTMMSNPQMQQIMANVMSGAPQSSPAGETGGGIAPLLQVGQQLAAQMQAQNPDLVAQLRQQMGQANPDDPSAQSDQNPPGQ